MTNPTDQARLEQIEAALADLDKQAKPLRDERDMIRNRIRVQRFRAKSQGK